MLKKDNNDNKEYVTLEEYNELQEKYDLVCETLWKMEHRKVVRAANKIIRISKMLGLEKLIKLVFKLINGIFKIIGIPKLLFRNTFINRLDMLTLPEYKYLKFKTNREKNYYINSNKIKHSYEKDLVSIILPIYNGDKLMNQTLDSILGQSYSKFELIIVNDGSTDKTLKIAKEYSKKDDRITVIDQKNQKLPQSIANGFSYAKGEYSMWVGADDILHDDCVELLVKDLKENPKYDFVYPNVRLIDENNDPITSNRWYASDKKHPEYVMLPHNPLELCTVKNNYIAPICMYKSLVVKTLSPFSKNRFTVEDYDYWMRINDLFKIKHTTFDKPIFDYRRHSGSLTSHAKELNISKCTDLLMLYEDFRQDYYLMPLIWVFDEINENDKLQKEILKRNHMIISREKANKCVLNETYNNMVYVQYSNEDKIKNIQFSAYKVIISDRQFEGKNANLYITTNIDEECLNITNQKGFFQIDDYSTIFSFIDAKSKDFFLRRIEDVAMDDDKNEEFKLSAVVCTYKRTEKVVNVLNTLINQTESKKKFEVLVVNNDIENPELLELVNQMKKENKLSDKFLRYVEAPIKGLSYARNVGMLESKGEIILYLDDDSLAEPENVSEIIKAYERNMAAGVVGGNIILKKPNDIPEVLIEGKEGFWSQYLIDGEKDKTLMNWYEFPYGANYSVRKKDILKIGGFRVTYGRQGHNYLGGEEVVVASLIKKLGKNVIAAPKAIVYHDVDPSRYTKEHVIKTTLSGSLTRVKMEQDLVISPTFHNVDISKREIKYLKKQKSKTNNQIEKFYYEEQIKSNKIALETVRKSMIERLKSVKYRR